MQSMNFHYRQTKIENSQYAMIDTAIIKTVYLISLFFLDILPILSRP